MTREQKKKKKKEQATFTFSLTFSNEDGDTTEKQTKNTSVCG